MQLLLSFIEIHRNELSGKTHDPGCLGGWHDVKKTHEFVGVISYRYYGKELHYAVSDHDPIFAGAVAIKRSMAIFSSGKWPNPKMFKKLGRVHDKYFDVILAPVSVK